MCKKGTKKVTPEQLSLLDGSTFGGGTNPPWVMMKVDIV